MLGLTTGAAISAIGIQIIVRDHRELDRLQLAYAYTMAANWTNSRLPALLAT
jgi:hypothetical protein